MCLWRRSQNLCQIAVSINLEYEEFARKAFTLNMKFKNAANSEITVEICISGAWVVGGDWNTVLLLNDRVGSTITFEEEQKNSGSFFTWSNKQEGDEKKIVAKPKPFRFFNMWVKADRFLDRVQEVWQEDIQGVPMFRIVKKLKKLKGSLKELNKEKNLDIEKRADESYHKLIQIQQQVHLDPSNQALYVLEDVAKQDYIALNKARLNFLHQKVKLEWLKKGDSNTRYFHVALKQRRNQNKVSRIRNLDGVWMEET
ncbi:uncharacterized protein LOC104893424 [Beta vulgaris subsp. vulgaris]|uniref:uncharacterized protein LOC104893424 n=1 Tax=Beta vulgaris subsp. vulgaris TaxID=3555 RepID=UPI00053F5162|nr:uncharacterized protein LOC104893424 [Beta vulgaris subsp. vulgaris]